METLKTWSYIEKLCLSSSLAAVVSGLAPCSVESSKLTACFFRIVFHFLDLGIVGGTTASVYFSAGFPFVFEA